MVKSLQSQIFRGLKEIPDAITGGDRNAEEEFEASLKSVEEDFSNWEKLAYTDEEKKQVQQIRNAYGSLRDNTEDIFQLIAKNRSSEAINLMEEQLDAKNFPLFEQLTEQAINSDREYRQEILQQVKRSQETAELVLFLSAFGTISLTLLWAAYLSSDLFSPLREIQKALDNVSQGDRQKYLDTERADELGEVNQAFNRMLESLQKREKLMELAALKMAGISNSADNESLWENAPSRLILYQLLKQMRLQLIELDNSHNSNGNIKTGKKQAIVERLAELLQAVTQMAEFGFPLDLNLTQTDIRALLYDLLLTFQDQFVERSISIELEITPEVQQVIVDRLKLREALSQLIDNALETLPERGGRIRILTCITADRQELVIQITNNGTAINKSLLAGILDPTDVFSGQESLFQGRENQKLIGLKLTKAIVEQHGGELIVNSEPDRDNQVLIRLPMVRSQELALKV